MSLRLSKKHENRDFLQDFQMKFTPEQKTNAKQEEFEFTEFAKNLHGRFVAYFFWSVVINGDRARAVGVESKLDVI